MSFDIEWSKLDQELADKVQEFLNNHFKSITKPAFIGDIAVTDFAWGTEAPHIEITDITEPFSEFYELDHDTPPTRVASPPYSEASIQQQRPSPSPMHLPPGSLTGRSPSLPPQPSPSLQDPQPLRQPFPQARTPPLSQHQRFQLMHTVRSPLTAPQHTLGYFSPPPLSSATVSRSPSLLAPSLHSDWIDGVDDDGISESPDIVPTLSNGPASTPGSMGKDTAPPEMDFQAHLLISYKGDMSMTLLTELRMNYPSMMFMSLPIQLSVRSIEFEATAVVAYIQSMKRICVSMLEPEPEDPSQGRGRNMGLENLLKDVHIESVVGDKQKQVLKNVGKIEKFIVDQLRKIIDDELVFPSYQCVELG